MLTSSMHQPRTSALKALSLPTFCKEQNITFTHSVRGIKAMNAKYKKLQEGSHAVSLLCLAML